MFYALYDNSINVKISSDNYTSIFVTHMNAITSDIYLGYDDGTGSGDLEIEITLKKDVLFTYNLYYGRPNKLQCSFQSPKVKEITQYNIVLLLYVTGYYSSKEIYICDAIMQALREIINVFKSYILYI